MTITLDKVSKKILTLLEKHQFDYLIIGGLAVSIVGEARMTLDLDILIFIERQEIERLLKIVRKDGFAFDRKTLDEDITLRGIFKLSYDNLHVDFICGAMPFELEALKRKQTISLYGMKIPFPTPEDLILFKLIPGREKDLFDAKGIFIRHRGKLDLDYLRKWAAVISADLQDHRTSRRLEELIAVS